MTAAPDTAQRVIDDCLQAAAANAQSLADQGSLLQLTAEDGDELLVSADLHGNRLNFRRLCQVADLAGHPRRHLVMQEVCHGGPCYPGGLGCMSHLLLEDVARLKVEFPRQFHFLLSNHELAEMTDHPISKGGRLLNLQFRQGVQQMYGDRAPQVRAAYREFLRQCPLAIRLASRVFISHSLPDQTDVLGFDVGLFRRKPEPADLLPGGAAFRLVWGRDFRAANAAAFARLVDADLLIHGHEPCGQGYATPNAFQIILDCCGQSACYLTLPIQGAMNHPDAVRQVRRLDGA